MKFLSNSLANLLSKSKLAPLISNSHNKKLKLLRRHLHEGIYYFSSLPTSKNFPPRDDDGDDDAIWFNFPRFGSSFSPLYSCKSLLLTDVGRRAAALWNPTTDEIKKLPDCPQGAGCYGFGFDPASQDYKVIRFVKWEDRYGYGYGNRTTPFQVELYSLKTDSWKDITSRYPYTYIPISPYVHINGFYYWAVGNSIISFDFANENFSHIPLFKKPYKGFADAPFNFLLVNLHGSLAALVYTNILGPTQVKREEPFQFEIWAWNGESWTKGPTEVIPSAAAFSIQALLGLFENDQLYLRHRDRKVLLFDRATGVLKDLGLNAERILPYVESSIPINGEKIIRASSKLVKINN